MPIYKTARFRVREDGLTDSLEAIRRFVEHVKDNEPGTLEYTSVQSTSRLMKNGVCRGAKPRRPS